MNDDRVYELLKAAQEGDQLAFEALHALMAPALARFVGRLVGSPQEAEDIVQEAFLTLYLHLARIDPPEKLRPFLYRVARNRCYDRLRRSARFEEVAWENDDGGQPVRVSFAVTDVPSADDAAHWLLLHHEVQQAIERLPELQRQTLLLYAEEGLNYNDIADVMNVSLGTVKSRMFHAKKTLRGFLSPATLAAIRDETEAASPLETATIHKEG